MVDFFIHVFALERNKKSMITATYQLFNDTANRFYIFSIVYEMMLHLNVLLVSFTPLLKLINMKTSVG